MITFKPSAQHHLQQAYVYKTNRISYLQPKDSVCFTEGSEFKPLRPTKEYVKNLISKEVQNDPNFKMPVIRFYLEFGFGKNRFHTSSNTFLITDNKMSSKNDQVQFDKSIQQITQFAKNHSAKMNEITKKSCEIIGIEEKDHPEIYLCYEESNPIGRFLENKNAILFNTYWLNSAAAPEVLIASTILHEMSHSKTKQSFAYINPDKFKEELKKHPELLEKLEENPSWLNQIGTGKEDKQSLNRNIWHYIKNLQDLFIDKKSQLSGLKSSNTIKDLKKDIAKLCNMDYIDITGLRLDKLATNEMIEGNSNISNVLFTQEKQQKINEKLNNNKMGIIKLIEPYKELIIKYYKDVNNYKTIYNEALARFSSGIGILKMMQEGILPQTEINRNFAIAEMDGLQELILETDEEVKDLIKAGKINI